MSLLLRRGCRTLQHLGCQRCASRTAATVTTAHRNDLTSVSLQRFQLRSYNTPAAKYARVNQALQRFTAMHARVLEATQPLYTPLQYADDGLLLNGVTERAEHVKEVTSVLQQYIIAANEFHTQLLATFNIHSANNVQELVKKRVLPPAAIVYQQRFQEFAEKPAEDEVEATLIAATNYVPRLQLALLNGPLAEHIVWGDGQSLEGGSAESNASVEEQGNLEEAEEEGSSLDKVFSFMEETILELGTVFREFLGGSADAHPYLMQLLTNYVLAVEESYLLLRWERTQQPIPQTMQQCYDESRQSMTNLLATLARFPLERSLGHLPPASPMALHSQFEQLLKFHNTWADMVNELSNPE